MRVKHVLPAFVAVMCALTACRTTANRFDLYSPDKPYGPATDRARGMTLAGRYHHKSTTYTYPLSAVVTPPLESTVPVAPPPPIPTGGTDTVAPLPTPVPQPVLPVPTSTTPAPAAGASAAAPSAIPGLSAPANPPAAASPSPAASPASSGDTPTIPGLSQ